MENTYNVLVLESLDSEIEKDDYRYFFTSHLRASVEFRRSSDGKTLKKVRFSSKATNPNRNESSRSCIENFINGETQVENVISYVDCTIDNMSEIHHVSVSGWPEPYKTMFNDLFDIENWRTPQNAIRELIYSA